ncbi:hypothetical protein KBC04_03675 [Candidatus Babeliales bacterium]|nr:hypothetical protein [Candidatus Babeliales bacterium]MBP9843848.1 hypothetical protein [Candidatus Babeliales bacterium]
MEKEHHNQPKHIAQSHVFSGHVYMFFAFDIGEDINFEALKQSKDCTILPVNLSKFFKNYHAPVAIEVPTDDKSTYCIDVKVHQFGAISMTYKIPVSNTFQDLKSELIRLDEEYQSRSINDALAVFKRIKPFTSKPNFFHLRTYYTIIQIECNPEFNGSQIKEYFSHEIAALLRFETQRLSEHHRREILTSSVGYFKTDLIIIDTEAAFIYDPQYSELLDFFELGNIQQLELQYFDKLLDKQMTAIYEDKTRSMPILAYLPFVGPSYFDPVGDLTKLKVDISVITERLENSIKLVGETYFSEIYDQIVLNLDLKNWTDSIEKKFKIIKEVQYDYQNKIDTTREDILTTLIIILIIIELIVAIIKH